MEANLASAAIRATDGKPRAEGRVRRRSRTCACCAHRGLAPGGLAHLTIKPRRKDVLLVDGSIFLQPGDGELTRLQGRLSKTPSFWVRRVEIVRDYQRLSGETMPVALESVANLLVAGRSTFKMSYEYESINGRRVGTPQPR